MIRSIQIVVLFWQVLSMPAFGADYFAGIDALGRHDGATALRELTPLANAGEVDAENSLGLVLEQGEGLPPKPAEAAAWYRRAADHGLLKAMVNLGRMLDAGTGIPQDQVEAVRWFSLAANRGSALGMTLLGISYENGHGHPVDLVAAKAWLLKAAQIGETVGMFETGRLLVTSQDPADQSQGREWLQKSANGGFHRAQAAVGLGHLLGNGGFAVDPEGGVRLLRTAAEHGDYDAADGLAVAYQFGIGVPASEVDSARWSERAAVLGSPQGQTTAAKRRLASHDPVEAFFWASVAERKVQPPAKPGLDAILADAARQLSPAQQAEQRQRAANWVPTR